MKDLVSVIITTKNEERNVERCLKSISNQSYKNIELIVVDNNSSDKTKVISQKYTGKVFDKGPERSAQRNLGAKKATGKYLLFLDADMKLSKNVINECVDEVTKKKMVGIVIPEKSFGDGYWARCKVLERRFYIGVEWMEAARFFSKKHFEKVGGYDENQTGTEDYDLPQRMKETFGSNSFGRVSSYIFHNEGEIDLKSTLKKKFYYTKTASVYSKKETNAFYFKKQSSIINRYKLFLSKPQLLLEDPRISAGMLLMKSCEFGAGGMGYVYGKITNK